MQTYAIPMVPGPVSVPSAILDVYQTNFGSGDLEPEYLSLYAEVEAKMQHVLSTRSQIVMQSGEAMVVLWGALKSCLLPGDRVLAISTGLYGDAIARMAASTGAEVRTISLGYDATLSDLSAVEQAIVDFAPKMITVIHCETPSGTLNPLQDLGQLKRHYNVPLLFVDAVSSVGGTPVCTDAWGIDLCLVGSQKCLSAPPSMGILSVNDTAWDIIEAVAYKGYDALQPFRTAQADGLFPYTPYWHGIATLNAAADLILSEGLQVCYARHDQVARHCRARLQELGYCLYPAPNAVLSPTVTAIKVPERVDWSVFNAQLRHHGLVVGGNYGRLAGKVFRLGHMGSQANMELVDAALEVLERVRV